MLATCIVVAGTLANSSAQLIANGSFEAEYAGTSVVIESLRTVDSKTFTGWRVFSVGSPPIDGFSATLSTNASEGNLAMRLDKIDTGIGERADAALDRESAKVPVAYGTDYLLSFDAAWISGATSLELVIDEYDSVGGYLRNRKSYSYPVTSVNYQHFTQAWAPSSPSIATINIAFRLVVSGAETSMSVLLDNVQLITALNTGHITLGNLFHTYDGSDQAASYTTVPLGLAVDLTYYGVTNKPLDVGQYTVVGTINDPIYQGSTTKTLIIKTAYDLRETTWFTEAQQANPAISGAEIDYDSDNFKNWDEYIGGTDPANGAAFPSFQMQPETVVSNPPVCILNWNSVSGRVYSVNWSPDLLQPFSSLQTNLVWPQSSYTDLTHSVEANGFYQMDIRTAETNADPRGNAEIIGSAHVTPKYFFGIDDCLNQGADELLKMGSKVIKIWYWNGGAETPTVMYPWNSKWQTGVSSLLVGLDNTYYTELFDKPFKTFVMNVASFAHSNPYYWKDIMSPALLAQEEDEFYEFTKALIHKYAGTGKTFIFQHHEGDWHTRGHTDSSIPAVAGVHARMVEWLNARQRGVTRAREELGYQNVFVYHAAEINVVLNSMNTDQPNIVNAVLPFTTLDLVSYSCYDTSINPALTGNPEVFREAIQYIKQNMPDSEAFGNDNVYIGEYGLPENEFSPLQIEIVMTNTVAIGLEESCPYIIYWQLYDNEISTPGAVAPITNNGDMRGFWMIRPDGTRSWHYDYLKSMINQ